MPYSRKTETFHYLNSYTVVVWWSGAISLSIYQFDGSVEHFESSSCLLYSCINLALSVLHFWLWQLSPAMAFAPGLLIDMRSFNGYLNNTSRSAGYLAVGWCFFFNKGTSYHNKSSVMWYFIKKKPQSLQGHCVMIWGNLFIFQSPCKGHLHLHHKANSNHWW